MRTWSPWLLCATLLASGCVTERSSGTGGGGDPVDTGPELDGGGADDTGGGREPDTSADGGSSGRDLGEAPDQGPSLDSGDGTDTGPDGGGEQSGCLRAAQPGVAFELVPEGPDTQIHVDAAFDGEAVWLAYNQPRDDDSGGFDVWGTRVHCDGSVAVAPFSVQAADHGNEIDPEVVVAGERVYVVWQADTGGDPNLFVYVRSFDRGGHPTSEVEQVLVPRPDGEAVSASAWLPKAAPLPGGDLLLATSWAAPDAQRWQVLLQRLGPEGLPALDAAGAPAPSMTPYPERLVSQAYPAVATQADGRAWVAWTRTPDEGNEQVVLTGLEPDAVDAAPLPPVAMGPAEQPSAGAALDASPDGQVYLALHSQGADLQVHLYDAASPGNERLHLEFGGARREDHSPSLAAAPGGGAVAWYRVRSGIRNDVWLQGFRRDGDRLSAVGEPLLVNAPDEEGDHAAPPIYGVALTHVGGGVFMLAWSEGASPAFRLVGRFVQLDI